MPSSNVIIYRISSDRTLDVLTPDNLVEAFTPLDALVIYVYLAKQLYVWKGNHIAYVVGKFVPDAKDLLLAKDPEIHILRQIVIESGNETQDFFDDLEISPASFTSHINETELMLSENGLEEKQHLRDFTARISSLLEEQNAIEAHQKASELQSYLLEIGEHFTTAEIADLLQHENDLYARYLANEQLAHNQESPIRYAGDNEYPLATEETFLQAPGEQACSLSEQAVTSLFRGEEEKNPQDVEARQNAITESNKLLGAAKQAKIAGNFVEAMNILAQDLEICQRWDITDGIEEINELKQDLHQEIDEVTENAECLRIREEVFQNNLADENYATCLEMIPEMVELAQNSRQPSEVEHYTQLRNQVEREIALQTQQEAQFHEKLEDIERLKEEIYDLESRSKFQQAREKCEELKVAAEAIGKDVDVEFATHKLEQFQQWEAEITESDMMKWDIPPLRVINRLRYNYVEVLGMKSTAQARVAEQSSQSTGEIDVKIVTMVRSKFKGQGPYNECGECYVLYARKLGE